MEKKCVSLKDKERNETHKDLSWTQLAKRYSPKWIFRKLKEQLLLQKFREKQLMFFFSSTFSWNPPVLGENNSFIQ